jgi:Mrp family chromosome partitioning ATPase
MAGLRAHFDFIVMDCPPICIADEMSVLEDVMDKLIMVVRSGFSREETVRDALSRISTRKLCGFVLNDAPLPERRYRPYRES